MKKVIVIFLIVVMVLTMAGCRNMRNTTISATPAEVVKINKMEFEPKGTYNISKFGKEYVIFRFDNPNDQIVVYQLPGGVYIVGEDVGQSNNIYSKMLIKDSEFVAISEKYLLLIIEGEMVAVEFKSRTSKSSNLLNTLEFDELSDKEKAGFVYPVCQESATD